MALSIATTDDDHATPCAQAERREHEATSTDGLDVDAVDDAVDDTVENAIAMSGAVQSSTLPPLAWNQSDLSTPAPRAKVLVPLYIYPVSTETWQPLYQAIADHPTHEFVIVVNPNSGPGGHPLPSHDYQREVPRLNAYPNVQTVGYVKIDYCRRPLSESFADIETYAQWAASGPPGMCVEGIFVDETPNHWSQDRAEYLHAIRKYIRAISGFSTRRLILENPGTPPDKELAWYQDCGPDVIFTSEEPYPRFLGDEVQKRLREYPYEQQRSGYMISGVPRDDVGPFTRYLRTVGAYLFVTDTVDDFYEKFGEGWWDYVAALEQ